MIRQCMTYSVIIPTNLAPIDTTHSYLNITDSVPFAVLAAGKLFKQTEFGENSRQSPMIIFVFLCSQLETKKMETPRNEESLMTQIPEIKLKKIKNVMSTHLNIICMQL